MRDLQRKDFNSGPAFLTLRLLGLADTETVKQVSGFYLDAMLGKEAKFAVSPTSKERAFAAHQLAKMMSHPKTYAEKVIS